MSVSAQADDKRLDTLAVNNFVEYLRIPSVHPNVDYGDCIKFLQKQAKELGLPIQIFNVRPKKPIVILTWVGKKPELRSILLNSHMDVVPVYEENWKHKPFAADIENGNIFARGTQDMKSVGLQYLEAIRRLKLNGVTFLRTIHISFVPDEEIGGLEGMKLFVETKEFEKLRVGVSLDEGIASSTDEFALFYGERCIWHVHIHCPGQSGHGSLLMENTPGEKVAHILKRFYEFRKTQQKLLKDNPTWTIGDVTTINCTMMSGGVQSNVVPPEMIIVIDCRMPVTIDIQKWEETIHKWCAEAGSDIYITYSQKQPQVPVTKLDDSNPFWVAFKAATDELGLKLKPQIFPGGTDSRYLREIGIPAIGFSPINNTPVLLHDNDEFIGVDTFLKGIDIYCKIISKLANLEDLTG
ncbi:aminoacylase-1-like [Harmonia axyridis]|uniref:aminoacylase-1-like n=1 Tax=Harmonia axyridis TaxID=115357 RepID=UPI001E278F04|nr:aminoacylase-1-like [Harmonia axyridis]